MASSLILAIFCNSASTKTTPWTGLASSNYSFAVFENEFSKAYPSPEERLYRKNLFEQKLREVNAHNLHQHSWKKGINEYSDWTDEEFDSKKKGLKRHIVENRGNAGAPVAFAPVSAGDLPKSVDWREKKVVTPVKNQGGCGSCWAFSATEVVESALAIASSKLLELAPQELVSCSPNPQHCGGDGGCQGSTQWLGFQYLEKVGLVEEKNYPYAAVTGTCEKNKLDKKVPKVFVKDYVRLPQNNYTALMDAVANVGPIAISVSASWRDYESGVFDSDCGTTIDHAVVAVGYGSEGGKDYWLVRNSWGSSWGDGGYIKIHRNTGECGTDTNPQDGTECKGGPKKEKVCGLCGILSDSSYPTGVHCTDC